MKRYVPLELRPPDEAVGVSAERGVAEADHRAGAGVEVGRLVEAAGRVGVADRIDGHVVHAFRADAAQHAHAPIVAAGVQLPDEAVGQRLHRARSDAGAGVEIDGAGEEPADVDAAGVIDVNAEADFGQRAAGAAGPLQVAVGVELGDEDVFQTGAGEVEVVTGGVEIARAVERAGDDHVAEPIDDSVVDRSAHAARPQQRAATGRVLGDVTVAVGGVERDVGVARREIDRPGKRTGHNRVSLRVVGGRVGDIQPGGPARQHRCEVAGKKHSWFKSIDSKRSRPFWQAPELPRHRRNQPCA